MRQEKTPILDYASQRPPVEIFAWQSVVVVISGLLFIPFFVCLCGYLGRDALLATVPTLLLSWWGFARRLSLAGRILADVVAALASVAFIKNLLDIGWFGHNPLFR